MLTQAEATRAHVEGALRCDAIREALGHLREARELLKVAHAPRAVDRVRRAMKSAEGAERHAELYPYRIQRQGVMPCS